MAEPVSKSTAAAVTLCESHFDDPQLKEQCIDLAQIDANTSPSRVSRFYRGLKKTYHLIDQLAVTPQVQNSYSARIERAEARKKAEAHLDKTFDLIAAINERVLEGGEVDLEFNSLPLLEEYLAAKAFAVYGCPDIRTVNVTEWEEQKRDCKQIAKDESSIIDKINLGLLQFFNPSPPIYIGVWTSPDSDMNRFTDIPTPGYYGVIEVYGGYKFPVGIRRPSFMQGSGPILEGALNFVWSNDSTLGSHRFQFSVRGGWSQHFSRYAFIELKGGLGVAVNNLNFGRGFPLDTEVSLMPQAQAIAGGIIPLRLPAKIKVFGGIFVEGTLVGDPDYYHIGPIVGISVALEPPVKEVD